MAKNNPFKFGTVVDEPFFTNRKNELKQIKDVLKSGNHLIVIGPRRYGKTSLILKAVRELDRKHLFLDLQLVTGVNDLTARLLKRIYRIFPTERIKQFIKHFRIVPTLNINPVTSEIDISFQPGTDTLPLLEDVFNLLEKLGKSDDRLIVVMDEFQDINRIESGLDKKLRAVIQHHKNVNYLFLGSVETMMREIFERKNAPFYHFGQVMPLEKIPYGDFYNYLSERFKDLCGEQNKRISENILETTQRHPYYTQQLAFAVWNVCREEQAGVAVPKAVDLLIKTHDIDYERLWYTQNQTSKKLLIALSEGQKNILTASVLTKYGVNATSTAYSSLQKLMKSGYVIKTENGYELDDPFFALWIKRKREE